MEGFMVDVGDLTRLIMAKEGIRNGENIDERLAHELCDCLWCIIVLASKYNIDLEKEFIENMKKLGEELRK
jgi:NTP pyrophosphatase (non-canonical NTP hydrolase)